MYASHFKVRLSLLWLVLLILSVPTLALAGYFYMAFIPLILMYQGGHELQHSTFFTKTNSSLNNVLGSICYALIFHNFEYVQRSHGMHHTIGRMDLPNAMVDHPTGPFSRLFYYLNLCGFNFLIYIFAPVIWIISPSISQKTFGVRILRRHWVLLGVVFALGWFLALLSLVSFGQIAFVYVVFSIYWGMIQNSAHYGLEFGKGDEYLYVARTYRVPNIIHFMGFGTPFSHFEHHVLPGVPGVLLNEDEFRGMAISKSGINPYTGYSLSDYAFDLVIAQWATPYPEPNLQWKA